MRMYVANGTHQYYDFQYRVPEYKSYRQQIIPMGGQIVLSGELSPKDIEMIIEHHTIYGMVSAKEFTNYRGHFIPYIYSIDEPISAETIAILITQNREYNTNMGIRLRREAAVTVNNMIEENTTDILKNLEVTIIEEQSKDRDATFAEGIRVTRDRELGAPQDPNKNPIDFNQRRRSMF